MSLESYPEEKEEEEEEEEEEEGQQQPEERRASGMSIESNITSDHNQENDLRISSKKSESVIPILTKQLSFSPETVFKYLTSSNIKKHNTQKQIEDNIEEAAQQLVESLTGRKVPPVFISLRD